MIKTKTTNKNTSRWNVLRKLTRPKKPLKIHIEIKSYDIYNKII